MSTYYAVVSGGVINTDYDVSTNGNTQTITFKNTKTFNVTFPVNTDLLYIVVGGGGGGAARSIDNICGGGGGGGGQVVSGTMWVGPYINYNVTVGVGGGGAFGAPAGDGTPGYNGLKSSFYSIDASGGFGGQSSVSGGVGGASGAGGVIGAGGNGGRYQNPGLVGASGEFIKSNYYGGGGGGGAGRSGGGVIPVGGWGGAGGGGAGGGTSDTINGPNTSPATSGNPNTGGGGGGNRADGAGSGNGGSGIVILTYTIRPPPCFKEDTKILTVSGYKTVQDLRKGDLIKTRLHGFVPIYAIGKKNIYHPASEERIKEQLYKYTMDSYPEVFEDLVITGCHSILVDAFKEREEEKTFEFLKGIYVTDEKYRLPACIDERSVVYETPGEYTIYHFALEHNDIFMNYGVYANGLLVETCSKRYITEFSNMILIE